MSRSSLAILTVAALALACAAKSAGPTAPSPPAAEIAEPASQPGDPVVTLLEAGAEPRAPLRYRIRAGEKVVVLMDMDIAMRMSMEGSPLPAPAMPPVRMTLAIDVLEVAPDGTARNLSTIKAIDVLARPDDRPQVVAAIKTAMRGMVGLVTDAKVTPRGFARDVKITVPDGFPAEMQSTLQAMRNATEQAAAIFPREPVGPGARWRVDSEVDTGRLKLHQTAIVKLDRREANRAVLSVTMDQTAPPQPFNAAGGTATLDHYAGKGEAWVNAVLDSRAIEGRVTLKANMASSVVAAGHRGRVGLDMDVTMTFTPGPSR